MNLSRLLLDVSFSIGDDVTMDDPGVTDGRSERGVPDSTPTSPNSFFRERMAQRETFVDMKTIRHVKFTTFASPFPFNIMMSEWTQLPKLMLPELQLKTYSI